MSFTLLWFIVVILSISKTEKEIGFPETLYNSVEKWKLLLFLKFLSIFLPKHIRSKWCNVTILQLCYHKNLCGIPVLIFTIFLSWSKTSLSKNHLTKFSNQPPTIYSCWDRIKQIIATFYDKKFVAFLEFIGTFSMYSVYIGLMNILLFMLAFICIIYANKRHFKMSTKFCWHLILINKCVMTVWTAVCYEHTSVVWWQCELPFVTNRLQFLQIKNILLLNRNLWPKFLYVPDIWELGVNFCWLKILFEESSALTRKTILS